MSFDQREKDFERKFQHDQDLRFRVANRRNRLLGLWAAGEFGMNEAEALAYAKEVVESDFEKPGDEDVLEKVLGDFQARGIDMDERRLRRQMDHLLDEAKQQIMKE